MNLTITKIESMHGSCNDDPLCPICIKKNKGRIHEWLQTKLTVIKSGFPHSPWWEVEQSNGDCYRILKGNLRYPGYYDTHPDVH